MHARIRLQNYKFFIKAQSIARGNRREKGEMKQKYNKSRKKSQKYLHDSKKYYTFAV